MAGVKDFTNTTQNHPGNREACVNDKNSTQIKYRLWTSSIVVFCAAVVCFANSYDGEFVFDDTEAIENNKDLLPSTPVVDLLYHDFWGRKLSNVSHKSYRPLTVLTFRWNYWAAGGLHPVGFHIVNILLHGVISAIMIPFFSLLMTGAVMPDVHVQHDVLKWSLMCSLLFAVHPVHTESVAGIVGRADLLCALFFVLSFLLYVKSSTSYSQFRPERFSYKWLCLSLICCGLATFSKEQGITVIGVCSAYDILCICDLDLGVVLRLRKESLAAASKSAYLSVSNGAQSVKINNAKAQWQVSLIKRHLFLTAAALLLLVVRWRVMGSAPPTFHLQDNPHSFVNGTFFRALNYSYLYTVNIWILLAPQWLCFDWSMGCIPTITSLDDVRLLAVVALWFALVVLGWTCLCSRYATTRRSLTLALALIVIPYLPAANILFRVGFVIAERVLYLTSAGFCLLVILGLQKICQNPKLRTVSMIGFSLLVTIFVIRSVQRSNEWRRSLWLFRAGEKVCPLNAKVHYNIGKLSGDEGDTSEAVDRYRLAIQLNPEYDQAMNNLANILKDQGKDVEAEVFLDKAVSISPDFAAAWMNRGIVKASLKKYEEAEFSYKQGIRFRKNYPDCYYNLGNLYIDMGRSQDALDAFRNATLLKPTHWNAWNNAIIHLDDLKLHEQANNLAHAALRVLPDNPAIMYNLASSYGKQEKYEESEKWFKAALRKDPQNVHILLNFGVLYHRWGKYKEAEIYYQQSLQLDPSNPSAVENMRLLKNKIKQS